MDCFNDLTFIIKESCLKMKYRIFEKVLNEVVGCPDAILIDEIEASSFNEANNIARMRHPNKSTLRIDDASNTVMEFEGA